MGALNNKNVMHFSNFILNAFILYGLRLGAHFTQSYVATYFSERLAIDIRKDVFEKLLQLPPRFHQSHALGTSLTKVQSDVQKIRDGLVMIFFEIIPQSITLVAIIGYLIYLNWKLTVFALVLAPVFVIIISKLAEYLKKLFSHIQKKTEVVTHILQESLQHYQFIQAYGLNQKVVNRFKKESIRQLFLQMKSIKVRNIGEGSIAYLQFVVILLVIWFGGYEMANGNLTGSELAAFFAGIMLLMDPVISLSKIYNQTQEVLISMKRVIEIIQTEHGNTQSSKQLTTPISGAIEIHKLSFRYNQDQAVLDDLNISVPAGQTVAIVGPSGAGKSTLVNLILQFYQPSTGDIMIDGISLNDYHTDYFRSQLAYVSQDSVLFKGTILENVRFGNLDASIDAVKQACEEANAWEFINAFPKGLYTKVGDRGTRLSGGQKQRIAIARAILRDPKILILDEATSALDSKSEELVQQALEKIKQNRTTIIIAHRLSTIQSADQIVVLENGNLIQTGTHQELIQSAGLYAKLYQIQHQQNES